MQTTLSCSHSSGSRLLAFKFLPGHIRLRRTRTTSVPYYVQSISTSLNGRYMLCDLSTAADIQSRVTHSTGERERNRPESFRLLLLKTIGSILLGLMTRPNRSTTVTIFLSVRFPKSILNGYPIWLRLGGAWKDKTVSPKAFPKFLKSFFGNRCGGCPIMPNWLVQPLYKINHRIIVSPKHFIKIKCLLIFHNMVSRLAPFGC